MCCAILELCVGLDGWQHRLPWALRGLGTRLLAAKALQSRGLRFSPDVQACRAGPRSTAAVQILGQVGPTP